jgi:hypothetical protein
MKTIKKLLAIIVVIVFGLMTLVSLWVALKNAYVPFMAMFVVPDTVAENTAGFMTLWGKVIVQLLIAALLFLPCYAALKFLLKRTNQNIEPKIDESDSQSKNATQK